MQDCPLDVRGLIFTYYNPLIEYRWVTPFIFDKHNTDRMILDQQKLTLNLVKLLEADKNTEGELVATATCLAIRQGKVALAMSLLRVYLEIDKMSPEVIARAKLIVNDVKIQLKRLLNPNREWRKNEWNLQDISAWLIPHFVVKIRKYVSTKPIKVISGSHLLAQGKWLWLFDENSTTATEVSRYQLAN